MWWSETHPQICRRSEFPTTLTTSALLWTTLSEATSKTAGWEVKPIVEWCRSGFSKPQSSRLVIIVGGWFVGLNPFNATTLLALTFGCAAWVFSLAGFWSTYLLQRWKSPGGTQRPKRRWWWTGCSAWGSEQDRVAINVSKLNNVAMKRVHNGNSLLRISQSCRYNLWTNNE